MLDLLPGYEHQIISAGLARVPGTAYKVVLHSTETGPAPSLINTWRQNPGRGLPHFLGITPNRIVQLLPLSVMAYTLENPAGGIDTNRASAIQIEVCGYAINPSMLIDRANPSRGYRVDWSGEWYAALGQWLADLVRAGVPLDLSIEEPTGTQWSGMDPLRWNLFNGVTDHRRTPEQPGRHWDPGLINRGRLLREARNRLNQTGVEDMDLAEFAQTIGQWEKDTRAYMGNHVFSVGTGTIYRIVEINGVYHKQPFRSPAQIRALRKLDVLSEIEHGHEIMDADELAFLKGLPEAPPV